MSRAAIPEQQEAKNIMRAWLIKHPHHVLSDIAHESKIPFHNLYSWINGRSLNFKTPAYVESVEKWVKRHESEIS